MHLPAFVSLFLVFGLAGAAQAAEITIDVPGDGEVEQNEVAYQCGDFDLDVRYINAGGVSLAVFALDDETIVASNVLAASGAKYAGGQYVWWTKGSEGDLYDLMKGEDAEPVNCTEKS